VEQSTVGASRRAEPIACRIIVAVGVYRIIGQAVWALMCVDREHHESLYLAPFRRYGELNAENAANFPTYDHSTFMRGQGH